MVYLSGGNTFFRMDKIYSTGIEQALVEHVEADKILVSLSSFLCKWFGFLVGWETLWVV